MTKDTATPNKEAASTKIINKEIINTSIKNLINFLSNAEIIRNFANIQRKSMVLILDKGLPHPLLMKVIKLFST